MVGHTRPDERTPRTWVLLVALVVVAIAPHAVALDGGWIFDDTLLIASNPYVHGLGHWQHWLTTEFWDIGKLGNLGSHPIFWRPWITASYALDWTFGGGAPWLFHATNLLLHAIATVLTFWVVRRWLGTTMPAFLATLLLAIHPLRSESVAWISGRPDLWLTIGVLVALQGVAVRLRGRKAGVALEVVGTLVAYASKEHAVVLPALAAIEAFVAVGRLEWRASAKPMARAVGTQALAAVGYLSLRHVVVPIEYASNSFPLSTRVGAVLESWGRYVGIILWPKDLTFGAALMRVDGRVVHLSMAYVLLGLIALLLALGMIGWSLRRKPAVAVGIGALVATLLPISNLAFMVYSVLVSPRLLYLPMLPVAFLLGQALHHAFAARLPIRRAAFLLVGGAGIACGVRNVDRSSDYQTPDRFWTAEAESTPDYYPMLEYFTNRALARGRPRLALRLAHLAFRNVSGTLDRDSASRVLARALQAVLRLTPDLDQVALRSIYQFVQQVRGHQDARVDLPRFQLEMHMRPTGTAREQFLQEPVTDLLLLESATRIGKCANVRSLAPGILDTKPFAAPAIAMLSTACHDFETARDALQHVLDDHPGKDARKNARAIETAIAVLEATDASPRSSSPPEVANAYILVGAYGRAYEVLRPFMDPAKHVSPDAFEVMAEVAFCAGDSETARLLLAPTHPPSVIASRFRKWSHKMRWIDAPPGVGEQPLPQTLADRVEADAPR